MPRCRRYAAGRAGDLPLTQSAILSWTSTPLVRMLKDRPVPVIIFKRKTDCMIPYIIKLRQTTLVERALAGIIGGGAPCPLEARAPFFFRISVFVELTSWVNFADSTSSKRQPSMYRTRQNTSLQLGSFSGQVWAILPSRSRTPTSYRTKEFRTGHVRPFKGTQGSCTS